MGVPQRLPQRSNSHRNRTIAGPRSARIRRISSVLLVLAAGVALGAQGAAAAIIEVQYDLSGRVFELGNQTLVATFSSTEPARLQFQGAGLFTISQGPIELISARYRRSSNVVLPGVFQITGIVDLFAAGSGGLASNGALTLMVGSEITAGFAHCFDLAPGGCASFVMQPASVRLPQTGRIFSHRLIRTALVQGQPPATLTFAGGGAGSTSIWTFSEIPGSRTIVPEPASGGLLGLGLLGLALAGARLRARRL